MCWLGSTDRVEIEPNKELRVVDRAFLHGDVVARAADALKRLSLLNGTKTKKSKKPLKASLELKSPPVDAEAAAAVFGGGGVKSPAAANGA